MTSTQKPTIGRIVHYKLSPQDAEAINRRRDDAHNFIRSHALDEDNLHRGDQLHIGNNVRHGDVFPMLITRVWGLDTQASTEERLVNGQVFLDGNDVLWVTSVHEGDSERQYSWPVVKRAEVAK